MANVPAWEADIAVRASNPARMVFFMFLLFCFLFGFSELWDN
jgi:hypothetical protein